MIKIKPKSHEVRSKNMLVSEVNDNMGFINNM